MSTQRRFPRLTRISGLAGILICGFIAAVILWLPRIPEFDGRTLSAWVRDLSNPDRAANARAHEFFKSSRDRTVNDLIDMLKTSKATSSQWRPEGFVYRWLPPWAVRRIAAAKVERAQAVYACSVIGPSAYPALPTLLSFRADPDPFVRSRVAFALGEIRSGPSVSVPALTNLLADSDANVRNNAARSLGIYGPAATTALPALTNALSDSDPGVSGIARFALIMIKTPEKVERLGDGQFRLRE